MSGVGRNPRVLGAALLLAAFLGGVAVGLGFDRVAQRQPQLKTVLTADMSRVLDRLDLTAQQRVMADSIVQRRAPATERVMIDLGERLRSVSDSLDAELRAILTLEQRARLDSLRGERRLMLKRKSIDAGGKTLVDTVFSSGDSISR